MLWFDAFMSTACYDDDYFSHASRSRGVWRMDFIESNLLNLLSKMIHSGISVRYITVFLCMVNVVNLSLNQFVKVTSKSKSIYFYWILLTVFSKRYFSVHIIIIFIIHGPPSQFSVDLFTSVRAGQSVTPMRQRFNDKIKSSIFKCNTHFTMQSTTDA